MFAPIVRPLYTSLNTAHSGCKPQAVSSFTHSLHVFLYPCPHISPLPPPHFCRLTPNHLCSYVSHAQTTSNYYASPLLPCSEHPKDCTIKTSLRFLSFRDTQHHTSISPSCALLSPGYAESRPSLPMSQSHMSMHSGHKPCISFPSCGMMHPELSG